MAHYYWSGELDMSNVENEWLFEGSIKIVEEISLPNLT